MAAPDVPSAVTAMRGLADAEITLRGPAVDLHSGSFGGAVPNPLHAMATLLAEPARRRRAGSPCPASTTRSARCRDRERELMGRVPFDEQAWLAGPAASRVATGEEGFTTLERIGARPTAEVNGLWGGYTGPGHKTIIPAEAHAKVTFRLVADQRPEDVADAGARLGRREPPRGHRGRRALPRPAASPPCASDLDSPAMDALLRRHRPGLRHRARTTSCSPARAAAARRPTWSRSSARR